ncbi:MAG TPA: cysteine desulfurase family protein [Alphaproteobacteria bacterium]|nr:cysteine desulfurase family protein [Alphaproteobacteria bacterium]
MIYLDYNATAPTKPAVRAAVMEAMERHGNPSSVHRYGRVAKKHIEAARASVAAFIGVKPAQVIFTSGGTEANNMVLRRTGAAPIITSSIEHDSVLACAPDAARIPVDADGVIDLAAVQAILAGAPPSLVSVMLVNNETGVIQPVAELARVAKAHGHLVHTDAVQAAGRIAIDFTALGVDFLTLSAHKIGGPQGIGALIAGPKVTLQSLLKGGGQEMNRRAGTENVAGIEGFGVAAQLAADDLLAVPRLTKGRDELQSRLVDIGGDDAVIPGARAPRVANTLCIAMRGVPSETQVMGMDLEGIAVSAGSACSSGKVKASHVLQAMGCANDIAGSGLRISLGWNTQSTDLARCAEAWRTLYQRTHTNRRQKAA